MKRRHPLAKCEECPWFINTSAYVGSLGSTNASVLVIGESPSAHEVKEGKPFTGSSGKLLRKVLSSNKLKPAQVRLTNAVGCHPPTDLEIDDRRPDTATIGACHGRLAAELDGKQVVMPMGNVAAIAVTGRDKVAITKLRKEPPIRNGDQWIIPTVNPGACLRNGDLFPSFARDVKKIKEVIKPDNIYTRWEPPTFKAFNDIRATEEVFKRLMRASTHLVIDIETDSDKDISFDHPTHLLSVGISYADNQAVVIGAEPLQDYKILKMLAELLTAKKIICHNGKYDLQVLLRIFTALDIPYEPVLYGDTMLLNYIFDERPGFHDLGSVATDIVGAPLWKDAVKPWVKSKKDSYALIPKHVLYKYNAWDAAQTWHIWKKLSKRLTNKQKHLLRRLCNVAMELIYLELDGVKTDVEYIEELEKEYLSILEKLDSLLGRWVDNPRSVPQVKEVLGKLELDNDTTGAKHLKRLLDEVPDGSEAFTFLNLILEQRKEQKLYGTYVKGNKKRLIDDRLYPTYMLHGSVTGRIACRNPNLQNMPRGSKIRKIVSPEEGHILIQADYSQVELRVIACESREPYLKGVFYDPTRDIHGEVSDTLFGKGSWNKEDRVRAKAYVFGSLYGLSPYTIALDYGITELKAKREQAAFFRMIPQVMKWRREIVASVTKDHRIPETYFGRRRHFSLITNKTTKRLEKEILAFTPQSTANDIGLDALVNVNRAFRREGGVARMRIPVHDSLMVSAPVDIRVDVAEMMKKIMKETAAESYSDFVPFDVDAEFGPDWGHLV